METKTMREQIRDSRIAYIQSIGSGYNRFAIYTVDKETGLLNPLWPRVMVNGALESLLKYQVFSSSRRKIASYHFVRSGCQYDKAQDLAEMLRTINPNIEVYKLNDGTSPAPVLTNN